MISSCKSKSKNAIKEWGKLNSTIKTSFKKKLEKILQEPDIKSARLSGFEGGRFYKIKLHKAGYRLVYKVEDERLVVIVIAVGKRERNKVYKTAKSRI